MRDRVALELLARGVAGSSGDMRHAMRAASLAVDIAAQAAAAAHVSRGWL